MSPSQIATLTLSPNLWGPSLLLALLSVLKLHPLAETASFIAVLLNVVSVCITRGRHAVFVEMTELFH